MENNSRQGGMADQASGNNEVHIALKLRQTDAKDPASHRGSAPADQKGTYGICRDCGEELPTRGCSHPWTRVHQLQEKQGVKPTDLAALLQECYRERLAMFDRQGGRDARHWRLRRQQRVTIIVNRERRTCSGCPSDCGAWRNAARRRRHGRDRQRALEAGRAYARRRGCAGWPGVPRQVAASRGVASHARNQTMLRLMLGEVQEQTRTFEQASAGVDDLLGRKDVGSGKRGEVGAARWIGD